MQKAGRRTKELAMKNVRGIIFDLDGVLVFTDKFHYQAWKEIADELGIYFDEKVNNRLRGVSRMDSLEIILERYHGITLTREKKEELAAQKNNTYRELLKTMTPDDVASEVRHTLAALRERDIRLSVGSSSKNARFILERVDMLDAFDAISDGSNITKSKPDPEVFLKAAEFMGLEPIECAVVEDAHAGIDAAKAGNMLAIGIGDAGTYEKTDYRINDLSDLLEILSGEASL